VSVRNLKAENEPEIVQNGTYLNRASKSCKMESSNPAKWNAFEQEIQIEQNRSFSNCAKWNVFELGAQIDSNRAKWNVF
jgi:hypothetical protein